MQERARKLRIFTSFRDWRVHVNVPAANSALVLDRTDNGLVVVAADPTNVLALDDVKLYTRSPDLQVLVATDSQIRDQIARAWAIQHDATDVSAMVDAVDVEPIADVLLAVMPELVGHDGGISSIRPWNASWTSANAASVSAPSAAAGQLS